MGFPTWTLIGMGVTGIGALIAITLAYVAQSPRLMARIGLAGARLDLRVREFTGYALALLLLAFGFFLAGVPLETAVSTVVVTPTVTETSAAVVAAATGGASTAEETPPLTPTFTSAAPLTPVSGAFGGPPADAVTETPDGPAAETAPVVTPAAETVTATPIPTGTPPATETPFPTSTATNTPTVSPTPTVTPTPIDGETAVIQTGGSTLWVRRSPGGQQLTLVRNGDVVILQNGRANQGGILWQEVRTVDGVLGWVQEEFLVSSDAS